MNFTIEEKELITKFLSRIARKLNRAKYLANLDYKNHCAFGESIEDVVGKCQQDVDKLKQYLMEIDK